MLTRNRSFFGINIEFAFITFLWGAGLTLGYSGGNGLSETTAYQISNPTDWITLANTPADWTGKYFELTQDISLTGVTITPVGNSTTKFTGTFDGKGYKISDVVIYLPDSGEVGLFGCLAGINGQIKNLGVVNADIHGRQIVGGLVGYINFGTMSDCYVIGSVTGGDCVGGLLGYNDSGTVNNCYASGEVIGSFKVGGLLGYNELGTLSGCYSTAEVSGDNSVGGLVGDNGQCNNIISCFWDIDTSGTQNGVGCNCLELAGAVGKTTEQMKTQSTFTGWDFVKVWFMPFDGYPYLRWELDGNYSGGLGTQMRPYEIANVKDLLELAATTGDYGKHFVVVSNIDLAGYTFPRAVIAPDIDTASGFQGTAFTGLFDGAGHTIDNLTIAASAVDYVGLFGRLGTAAAPGVVKNLGLTAISISGNMQVGGLVGDNYRNSNISSCYAVGTVSGTSVVGGLTGSSNSAIINCYAWVGSNGTRTVGGLVGSNASRGYIANCYSIGRVQGLLSVGGLVGSNDLGGMISASYFNSKAGPNNGLGIPLTTLQMKEQSSYTGWDFTQIWGICEGTNYPRFQWQIPAVDWVCPDGVSVEDLGYFIAWWLVHECDLINDCNGVDMDGSDAVDLADFAIFAGIWME